MQFRMVRTREPTSRVTRHYAFIPTHIEDNKWAFMEWYYKLGGFYRRTKTDVERVEMEEKGCLSFDDDVKAGIAYCQNNAPWFKTALWVIFGWKICK